MSTSSNKQQKKGKDGMGKAGKRKEMVKDWCGGSCVCGRVNVSTLCGNKMCVRCVMCVFVCVRACLRACRSCDGEGRKDKGGGEKVREVKTVVWMKLFIRMYVCR